MFLLSFLFLCLTNSSNGNDCSVFRYGKFIILSKTLQEWQPQITRTENDTQTETFLINGQEIRSTYSVEWHTECHFTLKYIYSKDELMTKVYKTNESLDVHIERKLNKTDFIVKTVVFKETFYDTLRKVDEFPERK